MKPLSNPLVITLAELKKFIKAQKNDRKIDLYEGSPVHSTGCILHHFAASRGIKFTYCSFATIRHNGELVAMVENEKEVKELFAPKDQWPEHLRPNCVDYPFGEITYGELKKMLK